jgi:hypothetical protein
MISNDYQLELATSELVKWRDTVGELEALLPTLPRSIAAQLSPHRLATLHQRIRTLETEIQQYKTAQRHVMDGEQRAGIAW